MKTMERNAFEYLYQSKKDQAIPEGICHEYEEGVMKGIVDMAHMAGIITIDELKEFYTEISEIYSPIKRVNAILGEDYKKAE
jgi:hypothetical protein